MAAKKKTNKKATGLKKSTGRKSPAKQPAQKRRTAKKLAKRKAAPEKKALANTSRGKTESGVNRKGRKSQQPGLSAFARKSLGLQSGDLQGLSKVASVDSESVDELMEEGNAFEAGVVSGVEDSRERNGQEVRTREVPEDDVPAEYLEEE